MKIIRTPWKDFFIDLVSKSRNSIKIASPFVKSNMCDLLINTKSKNTKIELITSFKLINLYSGSIDLEGLENIVDSRGVVKNFPPLHAKIYLFDNTKAIITSSNLTDGGLLNNFEYGIYLTEKELIHEIVSDFEYISKSEKTGLIGKEEISTVKQILKNLPKRETLKLPKTSNEKKELIEDTIGITKESLNSIVSSLKGWKAEIFKCLNEIQSQVFTLNDVYRFEERLKKIYPENRNIKDKIRQQLQYLRDLGLIEFLGHGKYRKLWILT